MAMRSASGSFMSASDKVSCSNSDVDQATILFIAGTTDQAFFFQPVNDTHDGAWAQVDRFGQPGAGKGTVLFHCQQAGKLRSGDFVPGGKFVGMQIDGPDDAAQGLQDTQLIIFFGNARFC